MKFSEYPEVSDGFVYDIYCLFMQVIMEKGDFNLLYVIEKEETGGDILCFGF